MEARLKQQDEYIAATEAELSTIQDQFQETMKLFKESEVIIAAKEEELRQAGDELSATSKYNFDALTSVLRPYLVSNCYNEFTHFYNLW